ncbi:MAG: 3-deoxy-D-manno-octulosonic acid transferase [Burkholderiales bacterium]|nr:3-deoxy-D-manno-octulosonic acid transferase [Burkholderiales bacterium]
MERFALAAYAALLRLAAPLYLARLWWRGAKEPGYRQHVGERLGLYRQPASSGALWLHAVSLGETRAAAALIDALRAQRPGLRLLLTHGTATGREAGRALLRPGDAQAWLPYDTPGAARRFLARFQPIAGVLMETELWPNLLCEAQHAGVPVVLANARLSERSARRGERLAWLMHPAARRLALAMAQTEADARRLRAAGAPQVQVMGNLKFDMAPSPEQIVQGRAWRRALDRTVVLMASSREGEEAPLLDAWRALPAPRPLLLLVPRHPQRFDEVAALVTARGLTLARRAAWNAAPPNDAGIADVWLGDSLGEMALYYAAADVALLGGSFAPLGGQNLIEAVACGCPLVMGPHTFNFAQAAEQAEAAGAALRVADVAQAVTRAVALADEPSRTAWVERALAFSAAHRGAAQSMAEQVLTVSIASEKR